MEVRCHCGAAHYVSIPQFIDDLQHVAQLENCIERAQGRLKAKLEQPRVKVWMISARDLLVLGYFAEDKYLDAIEHLSQAAKKYSAAGEPRKLEIKRISLGADEVEEYLRMPRSF